MAQRAWIACQLAGYGVAIGAILIFPTHDPKEMVTRIAITARNLLAGYAWGRLS